MLKRELQSLPNPPAVRKLKLKELNRINKDEYVKADKIPLTIVLDNIRSGMNIGSVFRTSDAFLVSHIYLTGISATPPHREILKTAIGATESVSWSYVSHTRDCIMELRAAGQRIYAVEQTTESMDIRQMSDIAILPTVLVFGNEVGGVSDDILDLMDGSIEVPQFGTKHSLNVSVCAGILIWEFYKLFS